jgi:hypothetical protein
MDACAKTRSRRRRAGVSSPGIGRNHRGVILPVEGELSYPSDHRTESPPVASGRSGCRVELLARSRTPITDILLEVEIRC